MQKNNHYCRTILECSNSIVPCLTSSIMNWMQEKTNVHEFSECTTKQQQVSWFMLPRPAQALHPGKRHECAFHKAIASAEMRCVNALFANMQMHHARMSMRHVQFLTLLRRHCANLPGAYAGCSAWRYSWCRGFAALQFQLTLMPQNIHVVHVWCKGWQV